MSFILLFLFIFLFSMCALSMGEDGFEEIPSEFDGIPEIANRKYVKQTYSRILNLQHIGYC